MAGEGLFFSGVVLKNNRNLLQEEAVRQQLALRREELNLSKAQLEDERKKFRANQLKLKKAQLEPIGFEIEEIDSNLIPAYRDEYNNYVQFIADNQDNPQLDTIKKITETNINSHANILKDITSKFQSYNEQAIKTPNTFKKDDQGNLLYNQIFNNIVLQYNKTGNIEEALKNNPFDIDDVLISSSFKDPISAYAKDLTNNEKNYIKLEDKIIKFTPEVEKKLTRFIISNSNFDVNNQFVNSDMERILTGKNKTTFLIDGNIESADARFMFSINEDKDLQTGEESVANTSPNNYDDITPGSDSFNPKRYKEFQKFLAKEQVKLYKSIYQDTPVKKDKKYNISNEEINFLQKKSETFRNIGVTGLQLKTDENMFASAPADSEIKISVTKDNLKRIEGQNIGEGQEGEGYDKYFLGAKDVETERQSVEATITSIGILRNTNQPVAVMKFNNAEFAVPLSEITTSKLIRAFPKGTVGNTIIEYSKYFSGIEKENNNKNKATEADKLFENQSGDDGIGQLG